MHQSKYPVFNLNLNVDNTSNTNNVCAIGIYDLRPMQFKIAHMEYK